MSLIFMYKYHITMFFKQDVLVMCQQVQGLSMLYSRLIPSVTDSQHCSKTIGRQYPPKGTGSNERFITTVSPDQWFSFDSTSWQSEPLTPARPVVGFLAQHNPLYTQSFKRVKTGQNYFVYKNRKQTAQITDGPLKKMPAFSVNNTKRKIKENLSFFM